MRYFFLTCLVALLLCSCDSRRVYEYNQDFKNRQWMAADTTTFEFSIDDPGKQYNLLYNVRNSLDYPYSRLFVSYVLEDSSGAVLQKKLVSTFLFDQKSGKPHGNSSLGDVYDHQLPLIDHYTFSVPGKYRMKFQQFMRKDTLAGILSVGVRVETVEEKK